MGSESVFTDPFQAYSVDIPVCNNWADIGLPEVYNDPDLASFNGATTQTSPTDDTHFVKQTVGVFATDAAAAAAFHRVVDRTVGCSGQTATMRIDSPFPGRCRCGRSPAARPGRPTPRGPSRKRGPIDAASARPGYGRMFCCKRKSVSPETAVPR